MASAFQLRDAVLLSGTVDLDSRLSDKNNMRGTLILHVKYRDYLRRDPAL